MAEDIKILIEKIQQEGVKVAEDKARQIEDEAKERAEQIVEEAKNKAGKIINEARDSVSKMEEKQKTLLAQAARDLLLVLRKEINAVFEGIISVHVKDTLTPEALTKIITALVKDYGAQGKNEIIVSLKKEDLEALEKGFLRKLQEEIKKGIMLKASDELNAGFLISFDTGKSQCDFSDKALADYIGAYLKPKLAEILKEATAK